MFGFGYAFDGAVIDSPELPATRACHFLYWGHQIFELMEGRNLIGRNSEAEVWVGHSSVSREHALIFVCQEKAEIEDLRIKNGTWCGTRKVSGRITLADGDEVRVGKVLLIYRMPSAAGTSIETVTAL